MKSTASRFNIGRRLKSDLRSYWWFALIVLLSMIFIGPTLVFFGLSQSVKTGTLIFTTLEFASGTAYYGLYALAMLFGAILALRLSMPQHKKQQIDHFHSLPVRRSQMMTLNFLTAIILFAAVLAVICLLTFIIFTIFMKPLPMMIGWTLAHYLQILLFFTASFAITMFAGQLTGHLLAQIEMALLLHFGIPLFALVMNGLFTLEWATYVSNFFIQKLYLWSLPTAFINVETSSQFPPAQNQQTVTAELINYFDAPWLPKTVLTCLILVTILAVVLTYVLYNRRPLERGGQTFIYPHTAYPVKAYLLFVATLAGGLFTVMAIEGGFLVFLVSFLLVGALVHIFCAIAFNRDVRSIGKNILSTVVILALTFGFYLAVHTDIIGFDDYTPKAENVTHIDMDMNSAELFNTIHIKERADINHAVALAKVAKENNLVDKEANTNRSVSMTFTWYNKNDRPVARRYTVDKTLMDKIYQPLYDSQTYREAYWHDFLQINVKKDITGMQLTPYSYGVPDGNSSSADATVLYDRQTQEHSNAKHAAAASELITALKHDLVARHFSDLNDQAVAFIDLDFVNNRDNDQRATNHLTIQIFEGDVHSCAAIEKLRAAGLLPPDVNESVLTETHSLRILKAPETTEPDADPAVAETKEVDPTANLKEVALITDPALVREIITKASVRIDHVEDIGLLTDGRYLIESPDNPNLYQRAFLKDHIPKAVLDQMKGA